MAPLDLRRAYWEARAARCITDAERVDSTAASQRARFATIDSLLFPGCTVLDVGCGVGDLLGYLTGRGCDYLGVDLAPGMVERARAKYPAGRFEVADILAWESVPRFDIVVAIGIHSDPIPDAALVLEQILARQFALCRVAAHASLLSSHYPHGSQTLCWSPAWVFATAAQITPWVSLRHDYLPHDFSVTLRREQVRP